MQEDLTCFKVGYDRVYDLRSFFHCCFFCTTNGNGTFIINVNLHTCLFDDCVNRFSALSYNIADLLRIDLHLNDLRCKFTDFEAGQVFEGKVISIKEFGAFLEFAPGKEGLVHISKIAKERVNKVEDVLSLGDVVKAVCLGKDKMGRFSFSIRDVAE